MKVYVNNPGIIAGLTLKNDQLPERNNMALHVCEDPLHVIKNREQLAKTLQTSLDHFVCAEQTHSQHYFEVQKEDRGKGATTLTKAIPETDALFTTERNIVLNVLTADCVPLFFYDVHCYVVGVVHSGWKGTVSEITPKTLKHVLYKYGMKPKDLHIHIGMALSKEKFEVDEDVYEQFYRLGYADDYIDFHAPTMKYHIDNQLVVKKQCLRLGIPKGNISIDRTCTFQDEAGFSYREDRQTGRHLGFIMKK